MQKPFTCNKHLQLTIGVVYRGVTTIGQGWTKSREPPSAGGPRVQDSFLQRALLCYQNPKFTLQLDINSHAKASTVNLCDAVTAVCNDRVL